MGVTSVVIRRNPTTTTRGRTAQRANVTRQLEAVVVGQGGEIGPLLDLPEQERPEEDLGQDHQGISPPVEVLLFTIDDRRGLERGHSHTQDPPLDPSTRQIA